MRKFLYALAVVFALLALYSLFVYFSWDILGHFLPRNSYEQVKKLADELAKSGEKLPTVDISTASPRFMIIVVDALSYNVLELGFRHDLLPNLKKIFASSCVGMLQPSMPMLTPRLLTSMATGVPPKMHDVLDFKYDEGETPDTGGERRYHAFWHIASERGYKVAVVGWPFTWPAEKVNGYFLSAPGLSSLNFEIYRCCYSTAAQDLIFHPTTIEFADAIARSLEKASKIDLSRIERKSALEFAKFLPFRLNPFFSLRSDFKRKTLAQIIKRDKFFFEMAKHILSNDANIDIFALYLESSDAVGHFYFHSPETVLAVYSWLDGEIGEVLKLVNGAPAMIVVGDHGMRVSARNFKEAYARTVEDEDWPEIGTHDEIGAFAVRTPFCSAKQYMVSAIPEELAPFILSVFDIPPSVEMENIGLAEWYLKRYIYRGDYSSERTPVDIPIIDVMKDPRIYEDYKEQLKAMGYM